MSTRERSRSENGPPADNGSYQENGLTVLVPVFDDTPSRRILDTAFALVGITSGELLLVKAVAVPDQTPLELPDRILASHRNQLDATLAELPETEVPTRGVVRVGHTVERIVTTAVADHGGTVVVLERSEPTTDSSYRLLRSSPVEAIGTGADCDVVVGTETDDSDGVSSILVPVAEGPHTVRAVRVAARVAAYHDAAVELLHVVSDGASDQRVADGRDLLSTATDAVEWEGHADTWLLENDDVGEAIIEQSAYYDVTVVGAPQKGRLRQFVSGSTTADVERGADNTVLTVRKNRDEDTAVRRLLGRGT